MRTLVRPELALALVLLAAQAAEAAPYQFQSAGDIFGALRAHRGRTHAWGDLDGDGKYDLITGSDDYGLRAFLQVGPLSFQRVDATNGLAQSASLYGVLILDFDRDGDNDVFLNMGGFGDPGAGSSTRLYRNINGHFSDVTTNAGLWSQGAGFGAVAFDYDRDGWLDIYVANHESSNRLFRNDQDGTFTDVTAAAGVAGIEGRNGRSISAVALDFDKDGWPDLYVAQRDELSETHTRGNSLLYRNLGDGTFQNVATPAGVQGWSSDFVVSTGDFDNDSWPDLYVATFNFNPNGTPGTEFCDRLYLNNGDGTFHDFSVASGTNYIGGVMGLAADDSDSDGWQDLYLGTGGPFELDVQDQIYYRNLGDAEFANVTVPMGLLDDARGHGSSFLDYDRDGDLDLFASLGGHTSSSLRHDVLYLNSGGGRHWLEIQLRGDDCNLEGIGAAITVTAGEKSLWRTVLANGGFASQSVPHVWFGLDQVETVESIQILWPCGRVEEYSGIAADQHLVYEEGQQNVAATTLELRSRWLDATTLQLEGRIFAPDDALASRALLDVWRWNSNESEGAARQLRVQPQWVDVDRFLVLDAEAPSRGGLQYRVRGRLPSGASAEATLLVKPRSAFRGPLVCGPNPFSERVRIQAGVEPGLPVEIKVVDARGRVVRSQRMVAGASGSVEWSWDGRDDAGHSVAAGSYVLLMEQRGRRMSTPLKLLR